MTNVHVRDQKFVEVLKTLSSELQYIVILEIYKSTRVQYYEGRLRLNIDISVCNRLQ